MCCEVESEYARWRCFRPLRRDGETKETVDERNLPGNVALRQPPHLTFPNHVYRLDTLNRSPCRVKGSEALHGSDSTFDCPVVLLNGLITNDKFCLTLTSQIRLSWARRPRAGVGVPVDFANFSEDGTKVFGR